MKKGMFVALITGLVLGVVSQVHAIDLGGMVSKASGDDSKASAEDPTVAQSKLVKRFVGSAQRISYAQVQFGKALGLKDEAAALEAETKALGSGSVSEGALKKHQARSEALNEKLEAKMESGAMLTADGRKMFASGLLPFSQGLAEGVQMKPESEQFAQSVQNYVKVASPMDKMKVMKQVKPGLYVASNMPAYIGKLSSTSKAVFDYAKSNKIEVPKEAAAALGEL
jgi:hypothetical protein